MKKLIGSLLATILLFTVAFSAFGAQTDQAKKADSTEKKKAPSTNTNYVGEITAVSATSITLKTNKGEKTASVSDTTKIKHEADGSAATAADLKTGERAHVWASKDKAGNWNATTIRVGKPAEKKKAAAKKDGQ